MSIDFKARVKSWFTKDKVALYLLSLLIAIVLWVAIISYVDPDTTVVISDVPVKINTSSQDAVSLSIVSGKVDTVDVEVTTPRSQVPALNTDSVSAEIDLTGEVKSGTYEKEIEVISKSEFVKIKSVTPSITTIVLDVTVSKTLPIEVDDGGFVAPDGYYIASPTFSADSVTVTGPKAIVDSIATATVPVEIPEGSTGIIDFKDREIIFLDDSNAKVAYDTFTADVNKVTVSVPIVRRKNVPLRLDFANSPAFSDGFYTITYSIGDETFDSLENIDIAVVDDVYDEINNIIIGTLDFTKIHDKTYSEEFALEMPTGVTNISGVNLIGVTIKFNGIYTDVITVSPDKISVSGVPEGKTATVASSSLRVSVCGSAAAIKAAKQSGVTAEVSIDGTIAGGIREYPVTVKFGDVKNVWVYVAEGAAAPSVNVEIK